MRTTTLAYPAEDLAGWERALVAFLVEKERRSGSRRTVEGYSRMLQAFFGRVGKTPDEVTSQDVFVWAHSPGASGKDPSPTTTGARIACVSSFFRFLIRMEIVSINPCDRLERPKIEQSTPRGLSAEEVRRLLSVLPETPVGLRNRAIILFLVLTGRRREEVFRLTAGDLTLENGVPYYQYRGKGGKTGRRELPRPAYDALSAALRAFGRELDHGPGRVPVAHSGRYGGSELDFLRLPPRLPPKSRSPPFGRPHLPPLSGQAASGCGAVHRGGLALPRSLLPRGHNHLSPPTRGAGGPGVETHSGEPRALALAQLVLSGR